MFQVSGNYENWNIPPFASVRARDIRLWCWVVTLTLSIIADQISSSIFGGGPRDVPKCFWHVRSWRERGHVRKRAWNTSQSSRPKSNQRWIGRTDDCKGPSINDVTKMLDNFWSSHINLSLRLWYYRHKTINPLPKTATSIMDIQKHYLRKLHRYGK